MMKSEKTMLFEDTTGMSDFLGGGAVRALVLAATLMSFPTRGLAAGETVVIAATGGEAIRSETAGGAWTTLNGPVIDETYARDVGFQATGTIVLSAPAGFEFNPAAPVYVRVGGLGPKPINGSPEGTLLPVARTASTLTVEITSESRGGKAYPGYLVWEGIQVRPVAASPLATGHLIQTGTCNFRNLTLATGTWGLLQQVGGARGGYVITGPTAGSAGEPLTLTIQKVDANGNPVIGGSTETLVFGGLTAIGDYAPTVNGAAEAFSGGITVVFDENGTATVVLVPYSAGSGTIEVTDGTYSSTGMGGGLTIVIAAGVATAVWMTPSSESLVYGTAFDLTIEARDAYGNSSIAGLPASLPVVLESVGGNLSGPSLMQDIGSGAGNGTAIYTGVLVGRAGQTTITAVSPSGMLGSATVNIAKLPVVPAVTVANKIYDGTTAGFVTGTVLYGVLGGDPVNLVCTGPVAFANKHVGLDKVVLVGGLSLAGASALNYELTTTTVTALATINPRPVVVKPSPEKKTYDGTRACSRKPAVTDLAAGDTAEAVQQFGDENSGAPKVLISGGSVSDGNNGANYTVVWQQEPNGAIEPRPLTVMAKALSKVYDGTTQVSVTLEDDRLAGDELVVRYSEAAFTGSEAGVAKQVLVTGIRLEGPDAANYAAPTDVVTTADIAKAPLTVRALEQTRDFGLANTVLTAEVIGAMSGDMFGVVCSTAADVNSPVGTYIIEPRLEDPSGRLANYTVTLVPATLTVLAATTRVSVVADMDGVSVVVESEHSSGGTPTGHVLVSVNGEPAEVLPLVNGTAAIDVGDLAEGKNVITVEYSGDGSFEPDATTVEYVVAPTLPEPRIIGVSRDDVAKTITVTFQGNRGWRYTVQASSSLVSPVVWENLSTVTVSSLDGTWSYTEDMTLHPQRFFRAVNAETEN